MATKIKASDLGCGAPYRLTYSGQVFASSEVRAHVVDYVHAYRSSVEKVVRYFTEVIARGGVDELTAYILITPSRVPPHIGESEPWRAVTCKESDYKTLKEDSDLKVIHAIAGYEDQTKVGASLAEYATDPAKLSCLGGKCARNKPESPSSVRGCNAAKPWILRALLPFLRTSWQLESRVPILPSNSSDPSIRWLSSVCDQWLSEGRDGSTPRHPGVGKHVPNQR